MTTDDQPETVRSHYPSMELRPSWFLDRVWRPLLKWISRLPKT